MEKNPIPEELRRSFDDTVFLINKLTEEAADLLTKFGNKSKLYKEKAAQVETLRKMYKGTTEYIEHLIKINTEIAVARMGLEIMLMQHQHALSFKQAAEVLGYKFSDKFIKIQEEVDALIAKVTKPVSNGK
jgi:hypothetical protein